MINLPDIKNLKYTNTKPPFFLIAGPCVIENMKTTKEIVEKLIQATDFHKIPFIFKASFEKANRTCGGSFTGIEMNKALDILKYIQIKYQIPILTDVHESWQVDVVKDVVDIIQIPAFLSRQTELIRKAGDSGCAINIKKGQFMSPEMMTYAIGKTRLPNNKVMITERGMTFGYDRLVVDFTGIPVLKENQGCPVILDCTHSLQRPNQPSGIAGASKEIEREVELLARLGVAAFVDGLFIETHPEPRRAKSDAATMYPLRNIKPLLASLDHRRHRSFQ